jgi:mono/diheme cytochrome c family protein
VKSNVWVKILTPIGIIIILLSLAYYIFLSPKHTSVWKGREIASKYGCFNCHGFEGQGNIKNPNYRYSEIPSWQGETAMMFVLNESELREWILYGKPERLKNIDHGGVIKMPAYKGIISEKELNDLIIYLKAVMELIEIDDQDAKFGYEVAKRAGCFGCHGPYGMGGMPNKNSLKDYIPGWDGKDFEELTKNEDELKEWILNGNIQRLQKNPIARFFTERQVVKMPAYRDVLTDDEIEQIISYINWLRIKQGYNRLTKR